MRLRGGLGIKRENNEELAAGRHCTNMQAYDIGGGQIRYDGVWQEGGNQDQARALAWAFNDFVARWDSEALAGRRLFHMQAYDIGQGQLRFDGIWEGGPAGQIRGLGLTLS
jgi:Bacterial tandem repeat domain 1